MENDKTLVASLIDTIDKYGSILKYLNNQVDLSQELVKYNLSKSLICQSFFTYFFMLFYIKRCANHKNSSIFDKPERALENKCTH